ncbi:MAG: hypothetical protein AAF541_05500 [Pseudomonadota bacterium]
MDLISITCYLVSTLAVVMLALFDPKRNRSLRGKPHVVWVRRLVLVGLFTPGLVLAFQGRMATLIIWVGVASIAGWIAAWLVNLKSEANQS